MQRLRLDAVHELVGEAVTGTECSCHRGPLVALLLRSSPHDVAGFAEETESVIVGNLEARCLPAGRVGVRPEADVDVLGLLELALVPQDLDGWSAARLVPLHVGDVGVAIVQELPIRC